MAQLWWIAGLLASAPDADVPAASEIIVTGERAPRSLQETQSSVAVFTGREIGAQAAPDRLEQLLALTPNVQLGSGAEAPAIRGQDSTGPLRDLPAFLGGTRPRVTLEVDGRAVSYNELAYGVASLWDIDQVEIYRTPQTTTQGRNAIAGAIFAKTYEPSFTPSARVRLLVGDARTHQASAMLTGPVLGRQLAFRVAADVRRSATSTRITSSAAADPNRDDSDSIRAKLLLTPEALPGTRLELIAAHLRTRMPQFEGAVPPYRARRDPNAAYGIFKTKVNSLTAVLNQKLASQLDLKTIVTNGRSSVQRFAPRGFGETVNRGFDWSGEALLDWRSEHLRVTGGMRADRSSLNQVIDLSATPLGTGRFRDGQRSLGIFAESSWKPVSQITVTAGIRHQRDTQRRVGALNGLLGDIPLRFDGRFDAWLPKVSVAYQLATGIEAGLLVQRAYNPGGTTIDLSSGAAQFFDSETLWDKELFVRGSLDGGRLRLNGNLFHEALKGAQRALARVLITPRGPVGYAQIINVPRAWAQGLEAEIAWHPSSGFGVNAGIGLLRTRLTRAPTPTSPLLGKSFQRSPLISGSVSAEWRPVAGLQLSTQARHNDGYFSDDSETPAQRVGGVTIVDARASWTAGPVTVFGYARNLFDQLYFTWRFAPVPGRPDLAALGDPRELGVGLEARF